LLKKLETPRGGGRRKGVSPLNLLQFPQFLILLPQNHCHFLNNLSKLASFRNIYGGFFNILAKQCLKNTLTFFTQEKAGLALSDPDPWSSIPRKGFCEV